MHSGGDNVVGAIVVGSRFSKKYQLINYFFHLKKFINLGYK
jgi:hypothetical protein